MAPRLNLRQIEAFRAVFLTGSMTAAGDIMGISQPAVSRLIRDLEAEIGTRLFDRKGTRISATSDAVMLSREVERSFHGLDRIARAAEEMTRARRGALKIIATPATSIGWLPRIIARFRDERPGTVVSLKSVSSQDVLDQMALAIYDLGVAVLPPEGPGVTIEQLPSRNAVCIMPAGHPLSAKKAIRPGDLNGEPMIAFSDNSLLQIRIRRILDDAGVEPEFVMETSFGATIATLVANGVGLAIIDPFTAATFDGRGITGRPFDPPALYELQLVYADYTPRTEHAERFSQMLREDLAS